MTNVNTERCQEEEMVFVLGVCVGVKVVAILGDYHMRRAVLSQGHALAHGVCPSQEFLVLCFSESQRHAPGDGLPIRAEEGNSDLLDNGPEPAHGRECLPHISRQYRRSSIDGCPLADDFEMLNLFARNRQIWRVQIGLVVKLEAVKSRLDKKAV